MNTIYSNFIILFVLNYLSGKIDFKNETVVLAVRGLFLACNLLAYLVYWRTRTAVEKNNDTGMFQYSENTLGKATEDKVAVKTKSNKEYDLEQVSSEVRSLYVSVGLMLFLHVVFRFTQPLLMQALFPLKIAYESSVVHVNLLGRPATGYYERPYGSFEQKRQHYLRAVQAQSEKKA